MQKILIASTPKTGNTWVKQLLAAAYDLPIVELPPQFDPDAARRAGPRWVAHQHYWPDRDLLTWAAESDVTFVTTLRHPGDVLVSLVRYVRWATDQGRASGFGFSPALAAVAHDGAQPGPATLAYVRDEFFTMLHISLAWLTEGYAHVVRYEDLRRDTARSMESLCAGIAPVDRRGIDAAVRSADLGLMRSMRPGDQGFYGQGEIGLWRESLSPAVVEVLSRQAPYPAIFAALGYRLDRDEPGAGTRVSAAAVPSPFGAPPRFSDGTPVPPLAEQAYYRLVVRGRQWPDPTAVGPADSFHAWLRDRAEDDPRTGAAEPLITNLAAFIHATRGDVRERMPDLYGADRVLFALWATSSAADGYELHESLTAPMTASFESWALGEVDAATPEMPPLPRLMAWLEGKRTDLDLSDDAVLRRLQLVLWFFETGARELGVADSCLQPMWNAFRAWAVAPANSHSGSEPFVTRLVASLHAVREDVRESLPDLYGADRIKVLNWFLRYAAREYRLRPELVEPVRDSLASWAGEPDPRDTMCEPGGTPPLTRLVTHFYTRRPDLCERWPDPYGANRLECLAWALFDVPAEYDLEMTTVLSTLDRIRPWANGASPIDPLRNDPAVPALSNLALLVYHHSEPLRRAHPDVFGADRTWFMTSLILQPSLFGLPASGWLAPVVHEWARAFCDRKGIVVPSGESLGLQGSTGPTEDSR